jgi:signal transduction histidine kinase
VQPTRVFGEIYGAAPLRPPSPHKGIVAAILTDGQPCYISDVALDPRLVRAASDHHGRQSQRTHTFTERQRIASFAGIPMIVGGIVVGVLCLNYRQRHAFTQNERQMLEIAAQFAATAIHAAETDELRDELVATRERMRLANELHHSLAQYLPAMGLMADSVRSHLNSGMIDYAAAKLSEIKEVIATAMKEVEVNLFELNARSPMECGLREALEHQAGQARRYFHLDVELQVDLGCDERLLSPLARDLEMVAREGITNAAKHAQAQRLRLELSADATAVHLSVTDDGCGFDADSVVRRGRGLKILEERIKKLNGALSVTSRCGCGTTLAVDLPIP